MVRALDDDDGVATDDLVARRSGVREKVAFGQERFAHFKNALTNCPSAVPLIPSSREADFVSFQRPVTAL